MTPISPAELYAMLLSLEDEGLVTATFRRLDPERQQRVLNAILEESAEAGPADLNIKRVAQRADVPVGSLYQYFTNRENLLEFAMRLSVQVTVDSFQYYRPFLVEMNFNDAVEAYLSGGVEWGEQEAAFVRFFAAAAYKNGGDQYRDRVVIPIADVLREMMTDMVRKGVERGELRADLDVEATARLVNALVIALGDARLIPYLNNYFQLYSPEMPPERLMAALVQLLGRGLAPSGDTTS